jgi:phosphatidylglycerol:prolipoprotein diacylglycerol transferase
MAEEKIIICKEKKLFVQNISPVIVTIGRFSIRYYSVLFMCAFLLGLFLLNRLFKMKGIDRDYLPPLFLTVFISVVIGARLGHVFFYYPKYYLSHPIRILMIWKGGLASHGAAIALIIGILIFCRIHHMKFYVIADIASIPVSIATSFVRLGNFFNSEIVGRKTSVPWAVKFLRFREPDGSPPAFRHPSQLYEVAIGIIVFTTLWLLYKNKREKLQDGCIFYLFLFMYFLLRFLVEFFKEYHTLNPAVSPLTMGQYLSIPFVLFSAFMLFVKGKIKAKESVKSSK